jgi:hypothetical protein
VSVIGSKGNCRALDHMYLTFVISTYYLETMTQYHLYAPTMHLPNPLSQVRNPMTANEILMLNLMDTHLPSLPLMGTTFFYQKNIILCMPWCFWANEFSY